MIENGDRGGTSLRDSGISANSKGADPHPPWMYVNYLTDDHSKLPDAYRFPLASSDKLQDSVEAAVKKIKSNPPPKPVPGSPDEIEWHHPSYLVFVLDSASQKLDHVEIGLADDPKSKEPFKTEHRLASFDNCTALYYINLRKNKKGDPLGAETELYGWKTQHSAKDPKSAERRRSHENTGTNVGP